MLCCAIKPLCAWNGQARACALLCCGTRANLLPVQGRCISSVNKSVLAVRCAVVSGVSLKTMHASCLSQAKQGPAFVVGLRSPPVLGSGDSF